MRILLSSQSRKVLFDYLKDKHEVSTLRELSIKMKIPFKTINHWHYDYKKYIPDKLIENYKGDLKILDKKPHNWGKIKGGKIGGKKGNHKEKRRIGEKSIKVLQNKYGFKKLAKMAVAGRIRVRKEESNKLELENEEFFTNKKVEFDNSIVNFSKSDKIKNIILPEELSPELAEEIGIHLGDGCLSLNRKYFSVKTNKKEIDYMKE